MADAGLPILIALVALPLVGLMLMVLWMAHSTKRSMRLLARTPCPVCREPVGMAAVRGALARDVAEQRPAGEFGETPPSAAVDAAAFWTIDCPRCQSELVWDHQSATWVHVTHPHHL